MRSATVSLTVPAHNGRHFIQYHNPDKMGRSYERSGDFSIFTNKPYSLVAALPGNTVWLIGGEGRPRRYSLCCVFVVDEIGQADEPSFRWYARGAEGRHFPALPRIDDDPWFRPFLWRQANFSLGLRELAQPDIARLQQLCHERL